METRSGPIMVPYTIRRSTRSRSIYIRLDSQNQVLLTIPIRISMRVALEFLSQSGDWVVEEIAKAPPQKSILEFLKYKPYLTLNGTRCRVKLAFTDQCPYCEYNRKTSTVVLKYDPYSIHEARICEALKDLAKTCLVERVNHLCELKSIRRPNRVTVRNQSSRWGSCSCARGISLNWRLILLTSNLQDYVILHELAHLRQMNHSRPFWKLLESYDPRSGYNDRRLNEIGRTIICLGQFSC